ncbi:fimbria/pilus periplasmic chaperone [Lonsdalea quercina]|uniref:fimbria/pilus periplasmic chaperone n=1 Tax=Lonsdalea quercina TaxID=71657 RepID=UPI00397488BE
MFSEKKLFIIFTILISSLFSSAYGGGIAPGATRVIYPESDSQASLSVSNSDGHQRYLIQAWVSDDHDNRVRDFIVTPPLFAAAPKSENTLRIVYTGKPLPADREVVYWMNVKAIPAVNKESLKGGNTLQLAVLSRMKLFMRPAGLKMSEMESADYLRFRLGGKQLTIFNPTPYYQSLVNLYVGNQKVGNSMVAPFGQLDVSLTAGSSGQVHYQTVNDYGAVSPQQTGVMQ